MARTGNQLGAGVPGTTYRCHPGGPNDYVFVFVQQQMWHPLLKAIGREDLIGDPRYETGDARWQHKDEVDALMEAWTSKRSKHEVMKILAGAGVPCGACLDTGEVLSDPHLHARDMIVEVDHPVRGRYVTVGNPIKLSASPTTIGPSPLLGQHRARDPDRAGLQRHRHRAPWRRTAPSEAPGARSTGLLSAVAVELAVERGQADLEDARGLPLVEAGARHHVAHVLQLELTDGVAQAETGRRRGRNGRLHRQLLDEELRPVPITIARSRTFSSSRTLPFHGWAASVRRASGSTPTNDVPSLPLSRRDRGGRPASGMSSRRSRSGGSAICTTLSR